MGIIYCYTNKINNKNILDKHVKHHQNVDGRMGKGILIVHIFIMLLKNTVGIILNMKL